MNKKNFFFFLQMILIFSSTALGAEIMARAAGYRPFQKQAIDLNEPSIVNPDSVLGWTTKPGDYSVPPYTPDGKPVHYTFLQDTSRAVSQKPVSSGTEILLLGCSFTLGWAVGDPETFAWKLQALMPQMKIKNFGVCGYGTYQSLLLMRKLAAEKPAPGIFVYAFNPFHEERNVASSAELKGLAELTRRKYPAVPYCSLDRNGKIVEHAAISWPHFLLQEHTAAGQMLAELVYKFRTGEPARIKNKREITQKLILEMHGLAKSLQSKFLVAMLTGTDEERKEYSNFFKAQEISFADIRIELSPDNSVPVDMHPGAAVHAEWAERLSAALKDQVR